MTSALRHVLTSRTGTCCRSVRCTLKQISSLKTCIECAERTRFTKQRKQVVNYDEQPNTNVILDMSRPCCYFFLTISQLLPFSVQDLLLKNTYCLQKVYAVKVKASVKLNKRSKLEDAEPPQIVSRSRCNAGRSLQSSWRSISSRSTELCDLLQWAVGLQ